MSDIDVNPETDEVVGAGVDAPHDIIPVEAASRDIYEGISRTGVDDREMSILLAPPTPDELDVKPTGEVFMAQTFIRRRLNAAFHPGAWAMRALAPAAMQGDQAIQSWGLYVRGNFVAEAVGGAEYQPNNPRLNWSDALESLKSNALMRLCKDLGIASECWDRRFCERFQDEHCIQVWLKGKDKPAWRRKDARPFWNETGQKSTQEPRSGKSPVSTPAAAPSTQPSASQGHAQGTDDEGHSEPEPLLTAVGRFVHDENAEFTTKDKRRIKKWAFEFDVAGEPETLKLTTVKMALVPIAQNARIKDNLSKIEYKRTQWGLDLVKVEVEEPKEA